MLLDLFSIDCRRLAILSAFFVFCIGISVCPAQEADEDETIVAEEMKVDDLVGGAGLDSEKGAEKPATADSSILGALEELGFLDEEVPATAPDKEPEEAPAPEPAAPEATVEAPAVEPPAEPEREPMVEAAPVPEMEPASAAIEALLEAEPIVEGPAEPEPVMEKGDEPPAVAAEPELEKPAEPVEEAPEEVAVEPAVVKPAEILPPADLLPDDIMEQLLEDEPEVIVRPPREVEREPAAEPAAVNRDPAPVEAPPVFEEPTPVEQPVVVEEPAADDVPAVFEAPVAVEVVEPVQPERELTPEELEIQAMFDREEVKRMGIDKHGMESLAAAEVAMKKRQYEQAMKLYQEALNHLTRPERVQEREMADKGLGEAFYRMALSYRRQGNIDKALEAAEQAVIKGYAVAEKLVSELRYRIEHPKPETRVRKPARWEEEGYRVKERSSAELLETARQHIMTEEYGQARILLEGVLAVDPHNTEAIRLMLKIASKGMDRARSELEATRLDMMKDLAETWNPRDYGPVETTAETKPEPTSERSRTASERMKILDKMQKIVIPEIDFRSANINAVIEFLQEQSVEFDPTPLESEQQRRGVNLVLNLNVAGVAPAQETNAGAALFGPAAPEPAAGGLNIQPITFKARYISLLEALDVVTRMAGLEYRIHGSVVMVLPQGAPIGRMITRSYDVMPGITSRLPVLSSELSHGGAAAPWGGAAAPAPAGGGSEDEQIRSFFEGMGVDFPLGSSIRYVSALSKIVVTAPEETLTQFEQVLKDIDVVPTQIEIETPFEQNNRTDATSLGLEWLLTDDWELLQRKGQQHLPLSQRQRISMRSNSGSGGFTGGLRYMSDGVGGTAIADGVMTLATKLTNPEISVMLHALEQKGYADMLSAPKVTTKAGQEATIRVVTEYIYPTSFEVTPITGTDANGNATIVGGVVEPSNFEMREVGVILRVTPTPSADGKIINLDMSPEVVSEPTWKNYGSVYNAPDGSQQQLTMEQPFFHTRAVATSILIYNGATVVMGGMITEGRIDAHDKIPVLGSLPLIGRLFRSDYEISEKRNLLIFVTAKRVTPGGRPVESSGEGVLLKKVLESAMQPGVSEPAMPAIPAEPPPLF